MNILWLSFSIIGKGTHITPCTLGLEISNIGTFETGCVVFFIFVGDIKKWLTSAQFHNSLTHAYMVS